MRHFLPNLIFAVGSLTSIAAAEKPNILLIIADDLNCELGCYGSANAKTPHIDAFARTAMRFERAYCQAPLCNPSRSSLLTGLRPASVGVLDNSTHFRWRWPDLQTLPQQFRAAGWHTAAFGKIFHGASLQIEDGASWDEGPGVGKAITPMPKTSADETEPKPPRVGAPNPWDAWGPADQDDAATSDGKAARLAAAGIARMKDRPFFVAVGFKKPHAPLHAPAKYFALHDATSLRLPPTFLAPDEPPRSGLPAAALRPNFDLFGSQRARPGTRDEALDAIAAYHSCVSFTDAQTGLVLDALEKHGLSGRTIVVLVSDHGFHLGEHGMFGKLTLFEECLRVPLLIRAPGIAPGVSARVVELLDLYPTLLELAGLPAAPHAEGRSLAPLLREPQREWPHPARAQMARLLNLPGGASLTPAMAGQSLRDERWHFIEWADGARALFDHATDPHEQRNLAGDASQRDRVQQFSAALAAKTRRP